MIDSRFRLDGVVSAGGMAVVYRAYDLESERCVAVKILRREYTQNVPAKRRFLREARLLGSFRGFGVPRILATGEFMEAQLYMVLELLHGQDLRRELSRRPFDVTQAVDIVVQVCLALIEAHDMGVVHRDIKPENVVFADQHDSGVVKLIDFGIAAENRFGGVAPAGANVDPLSIQGRALGSPQYMSPEQALAPQDVDQRADIWSLGVLLFELIVGAPPFRPGQAWDQPFAQLAWLPSGLDEIVGRCLRPNREERFADVRDLIRALAPFASPRLQATLVSLAGDRLSSNVNYNEAACRGHRAGRSPRESGLFPAAAASGGDSTTLDEWETVKTLDVS